MNASDHIWDLQTATEYRRSYVLTYCGLWVPDSLDSAATEEEIADGDATTLCDACLLLYFERKAQQCTP